MSKADEELWVLTMLDHQVSKAFLAAIGWIMNLEELSSEQLLILRGHLANVANGANPEDKVAIEKLIGVVNIMMKRKGN